MPEADEAGEGLPAQLDRARHVDLEGRRQQPAVRRLVVAALAGVALCALLNLFGQRTSTSRAQGPQAKLEVRVPHTVRGGLFFQGRFDILAQDRIHAPTLVLGNGWAEQLQIDTIEPSPAKESSSDGRLSLTFDPLATGDHLTVWMQFEVNPTAGPARRDQSVALLDGGRPIAAIHHALNVFP